MLTEQLLASASQPCATSQKACKFDMFFCVYVFCFGNPSSRILERLYHSSAVAPPVPLRVIDFPCRPCMFYGFFLLQLFDSTQIIMTADDLTARFRRRNDSV